MERNAINKPGTSDETRDTRHIRDCYICQLSEDNWLFYYISP